MVSDFSFLNMTKSEQKEFKIQKLSAEYWEGRYSSFKRDHDYKEHDESMATQQALVHRIVLLLGKMISWEDNQTYMGSKILELEDRILKGDPMLYQLIQENKYLPKVLKEFKKRLK